MTDGTGVIRVECMNERKRDIPSLPVSGSGPTDSGQSKPNPMSPTKTAGSMRLIFQGTGFYVDVRKCNVMTAVMTATP